MKGTLTADGWDTIVQRIEDGNCTPFLGAGASVPAGTDPARGLPTGEEIARRWIREYGLQGLPADLTQVAQHIGVRRDMMFPKDEMIRLVNAARVPDFGAAHDPHGALARLPFKVFVTTNHDDFLMRALRLEDKRPRQRVCLWNEFLQENVSRYPRGYEPTEQEPLVFHLHGHAGIRQSMVLTEDDYLDFLAASIERTDLIPPPVRAALMGSSLIFVGYKLSDWSFRVLFRSILRSLEKSLGQVHYLVQLPVDDPLQQRYLDQYYSRWQIQVYWGSAVDFVKDLQDHLGGGGA
jgi:hypothetical protein